MLMSGEYFMTVVDSKRVWKVSPLHTTYMELIFFKTENQRLGWKAHYAPFLEASAIKPEMQTQGGPFEKSSEFEAQLNPQH